MGQKAFQYVMRKLSSVTFAAGNPFSIKLDELPITLMGKFAHLVGITFEITLDPTYTTAPTVIGHNNLVKQLVINDGRAIRANFPGGFNDLRMFERLENGGLMFPDTPTNLASTNEIYWQRHWSVGPKAMAGSPGDYMIPCAALLNGEISGTWGALTDISADTTAATGSIAVVAHLALSSDLHIPPFYERKRVAATNATQLQGASLYAFLGLLNSTSYDAFAAGDLGDVTIETSEGTLMSSVAAELLGRAYAADFARGTLDGVIGEPRNATYDVMHRIENLGTPTALAAQAFDLQPVLWAPPGCRQTKLIARTANNLQVSTSGSQTSGTQALSGRFLPQSGTIIGTLADEAAKALRIPIRTEDIKPDTLSKKPLAAGAPASYMGFKVKVPGRSA